MNPLKVVRGWFKQPATTPTTLSGLWSDERHRGLFGNVNDPENRIQHAALRVGDHWQSIELDASVPGVKTFGFQYAHGEPLALTLRVWRGNQAEEIPLRLPKPPPPPARTIPDGGPLFDQFRQEVNDGHLRVLEIGSRIVSPGSVSKRSLFPGASEYVGFDYYKDDNTDIAGDAHQLASLVGEGAFDAIFSLAVLEHIAMPWVLAREINRALKVGGLTYHGTVFAWPPHERPWDFWRFSDEGLKTLFAPAMGFEVEAAGMFDPVRMTFLDLKPGQERFALCEAYASSSILARKTRDLETAEQAKPADLKGVVGDTHYPKP